MSYLVENTESPNTYTLYLQGEGRIKANEDSRYLFYNFTNLTEIENLEYLDTANVIIMEGIFNNCRNLMTLNLRKFDFTYVTNLYAIFNAMPEEAILYVKDEYTQSKILNLPNNYRPSAWTVDNVIIAS